MTELESRRLAGKVLTLFPEMFPDHWANLASKALEGGRWSLEAGTFANRAR
jgi:tRNA G37 N-methylase TrmD